MGLQVWLPLTKDLKNQGLSNVTVTNNGATFNSAGKLGGCYYFNRASSNYLKIDNPIATATNGVSMAFWVKLPSNGSVNDQLVHIGNGSGWTNNRFTCFVRGGNSTLIFSCGDGTNSTQYGCTSSSLTLNQWTHVVCIYNSNKMMVYLNGILDKEYNTAIVPSFANVAYIGIGAGPNVTEPATTYLNDVRIYDHALSPREVKEISKGLVLHYPLAMPGQENIIANTSHEIACTYPASGVKDYYSVKTKSVPNETQYTLSFEARSTVDGDHLRTHFYSPNTTTTCESSQGIIKTASDGNMDFTLTTEWRRYWVVYTQTETTAIKSVICPRLCSPASYPSSQSGTGTVYVRNQKLERGSHPTPWIPNPADAEYSALGFDDGIEYDVSGYQYNGTKVGAITYDADTPRYETSAVFDGSSDIRSAKSSFGWFDFKEGTVAAWFKPANTTQQWASVGVQNDSGQGSRSFSVCNYSGKAATVVGYDSSWGNQSSNYSMSANVWYHLCATITNGDTVKLYVNGELVQTRTVTNTTGTIASTTQFAVGVDLPGSDERFTGHLSDVRFYTTCLNESDVRELYNTSMSLSNNGVLFGYEFIE